MRRSLFLAAVFIVTAFICFGCGKADNARDAAYFKANPDKLQVFMLTIDKNLKTLSDQVERGHISIEEYDAKTAALLGSPTYKAAIEAQKTMGELK